jgi:hypothetical protein
MATAAKLLYVGSDNWIAIANLQNAADPGVYINDAIVKLSVTSKVGKKLTAAGPAVDKGGGKVGLPSNAHGLVAGDIVQIENTVNYDGIFTVDATTSANEIVITASYVAETFDGEKELVYKAVKNAGNLSMDYVAASNGKYLCNIPETAMLIHDSSYYMFILITAGTEISLLRYEWKAVYNG